MSESYYMRGASPAAMGSRSPSRAWSDRARDVEKDVQERKPQVDEQWSALKKEAGERALDPGELPSKWAHALEVLTSQPDDMMEVQDFVDQLFEEEFLEPVAQYAQHILKILDPENDWRNIVEFLGAWIDFGVEFQHPKIEKALIELLTHDKDFVFLAAARAVSTLDIAQQPSVFPSLSERRQKALQAIVEEAQ